MTEVEQPPQNGIDISTADDDENSKSRPADIEQDMREMERRKRVEAIMGSKLFREELERIVDCARDSGNAAGILQQLSDIVGGPSSRVGSVFKTSTCMLPINDIRGVESMGYAKGEKILRCKLAATFRLLDLYGWTQGLGAQITARLKVDQEYFLVNPYGLMFHEITASSLNKVDMQGNIVEQGTTNFGVNKSHFALHSVVHAARPDIRCAIYIGCSPVVAISSLKNGLLPLTNDACVLGELSTYSYSGYLHDEEERNKLVRNLGPNSKVLLLTNHGALCCGETIEEAFHAARHIVQACETQLKLLPVGLENLMLIPEEARKIIYEQSRRPPEDLEMKFASATINDSNKQEEEKKESGESTTTKVLGQVPKWRVGGAEFEALMRMLDNAGYRTGYIYRHPLIKTEPPKPKNDVELPPAVSSLGYLLEEEELFRQGIWKKGDLRKGGDRSRWLNSPNVYQKVEVLETGTPDPKKITKWVAEGSPTHSTPVRIEDPLQFVPVNTNPKEFKRVQQQIKDNRRADKISAGPQSHILEGVTWDEANRIKDATVSSAGDHVVLMGAASKGIIQRGFQHNAAVYKAPYAKNPFDNVTDDELNEYKRTVERKKKSIHGEYTDTDFSESEALSSLQTSGAQQQTKQTATTTTTAAVSQSEPEDISEHQVMRIQTQQAPVPSQPEVVLSDDIKFQIPQDHNINESLDKSFNLFQLSKYYSCVGDEFFPKVEEQKLYSTNDQQINYLNPRNTKTQILNSIGQKRNYLYIPTAKQKENIDLNLLDYSNTKEHFYRKQSSGNGSNGFKLGHEFSKQFHSQNSLKDNSTNYIVDKNSKVNINVFHCCTPKTCAAILESVIKLNNQYDLNHRQDFRQHLRENLYATPNHKNSKIYRKLIYPYRTLSHFGFNIPLLEPQPDHKHLKINFDNKQKYIPIKRTVSYEEIFSTPRYLELCEYCFEHFVRLKPEIMDYKNQLRGLVNDKENRNPNFGECSFSSAIVNGNHNNQSNIDDNKTDNYDLNTVFPFELDSLSEENNYLNTQFISNSTFNENTKCLNSCDSNKSNNIVPITHSERTTSSKKSSIKINNNNVDLPQHSNLEIIENYNKNTLRSNSNESFLNNFYIDVLQSENLQNTENSVNKRKLMNREERWRRKLEFQEIWEDHINFAENRENSLEPVNGLQQNVTLIQTEEQNNQNTSMPNEETYNGYCILIPHHCTLPSDKFLKKTPEQIGDGLSNNNNNNLNFINYVLTNVGTNKLKCIEHAQDNSKFYNILDNEEVNEQNNRNDEFTPLERTILEKININNLSKDEAIFSKIESSIRNKMTPYKLQSLLKKEKSIILRNKLLYDNEKENCKLFARSKNIKPLRRSHSLNLHKNYSPLPSLQINNTHFSLTKLKKEHPDVRKYDKNTSNTSISTSSQNVNKNKKSIRRRNFILENIRNASIPRHTAQVKTSMKQKSENNTTFSPVEKSASLKKGPKNLANEKHKTTPTDIYSFQSKLVKGSPKFWISMPQSSTKNVELTSLFIRSKSDTTSNNSDLESVTKVDKEINALGEEIQQIQPRLEIYERKLDDFGERITECVHNMNECVSTHEQVVKEQQKLKDQIVLHQYSEDIMCSVQTFSLSETED